jgi:2'-5' RNA ligase
MSKRLFVAIDLPDRVNHQLVNYAGELHDVRWYGPDDYHLTLKFIGEVEEQTEQNIRKQLDEVRLTPFTVTINRLGYFPPDRHPRIIWAGFEASESLQALHDDIDERLSEMGVEREKRDFTPHITLGKNKGVPKTRVETYLERRSDIHIADIPVDSFILYSSELTPDGAVHTPEKTYQLRD